ncbi:hypothetical protein GLOIN_2v1781951 [Rhizophagus irregularis DAOM 181602=DAOM 197198]|uniref:Uncharacterized protein n=1 Tax=Rhizophagus irregularis (strain DAOM 181602 / DAOM 197198 / MUCL 43194) TaxID=747089 RepID=U9TJ55_RHIID|nr:hypothetical protein GLOIN_2v1781951 [Rhizophagus irregularis DAOM 181602=DAOM 197198]POG65235.1 hypothetical protein GLOIN_2v1781951 [Rhizophagus irregularis DAOM 181602=DAOM 197198]GBC14814.1 hypothetical protein GLOIN_2v1781951 [Rhizophagus irregularis DAOM 181602=DAOM 197198]|eukprot:XP_025172101.1 hypothetical protein GLOIN_2v1781951 [Rhizophagus irregularis DAOM 181602=DAOM 197198]
MLFIPKSDPISRENFEFEGFYGIDTGDNRTPKVLKYQHLLILHNGHMIHVSNPKFTIDRIDVNFREKQLFLCIPLEYYVQRQQINSRGLYELSSSFLTQRI